MFAAPVARTQTKTTPSPTNEPASRPTNVKAEGARRGVAWDFSGLKGTNGDAPAAAPKAEPKPAPKADAPSKPAVPPPKADAPSKAPDKPAAAPKPAPPTITSETKLVAPSGAAKTRTVVAVGEEVTFTGSASGKWTASSGMPAMLGSGMTFVWTAPERAKTVTITLAVGDQTATTTMTVLEPAGIIGVKTDEIAIPGGTAGAGMHLRFNYTPKTVSFGKVVAREVSGPASNVTGYFKKHYTDAELWHHAGDGSFFAIRENNELSALDTANSTDTFTPYEAGTMAWVIPNKFKVATESGDGKEFTQVTQAFTIDAAGTETITKATASVTRKVTPH
jgi:hypothetical protein